MVSALQHAANLMLVFRESARAYFSSHHTFIGLPTDEAGSAQVFAGQHKLNTCSKCYDLLLSTSVHARRTTPGDAAALHNIRVCVSRVPHPNTVCVLRQSLSGETSRWAYAGMYHGRLLQLLLEVRGGSILRSHMPEEALERWSPVQV